MINPISNPTAGKTIFFQSLGCPKNLVDTEVMLGITRENAFQVVQDPKEAAVIVVNTCSFINEAKQESIDTILELAENKREGSCQRLIVTGCLPQRYKADLKVSLPEVDAFVGTGQYGNILDYIEGKREDDFNFKNPKYIHDEHTPRINSQPSYRAYLKISEGCIKNCSFCIIPKIRGTLRSRNIESLVEEATRLVSAGVVELNLIAQDLTDYGRDLRYEDGLYQLLQALVKIEGLQWIRLFYVYPDELSDKLVELIAAEPKICKYIDMPIQHINDRMLNRMNRKWVDGARIRERVARLRSLVPDLAFRSTVLVGYPGETQEEFEELKQFVKEVRFEHLGVFAYSVEENTDSFKADGHLPEEVREARRQEILEIQRSISHEVINRYVGRTVPVLVEGVSEESEFLWRGRHAGQAPDIDGYVLLHSGEFQPGQIINVKIEKALDYDLVGAPV
ncbi:MAG: 30S ribosomal protein S12 methylthiotransferase RimO [Bdellovibrionales bacterium]|nr:30S ribosomal protein S12 methylthiotransferase RimO [Bdellovibrionales bacterium]